MSNVNRLTERLRPHAAALQADCDVDNALAKQVVDLYRLHYSCPSDPAAPALCHAAMDEWEKQRGKLPRL